MAPLSPTSTPMPTPTPTEGELASVMPQISNRLKANLIMEDDEDFGLYVTFCKRYWGKTGDYGDSTSPEADNFIEAHRSTWEKQAKRGKAQGNAKGDTN
jgi:hypothetical protein